MENPYAIIVEPKYIIYEFLFLGLVNVYWFPRPFISPQSGHIQVIAPQTPHLMSSMHF